MSAPVCFREGARGEAGVKARGEGGRGQGSHRSTDPADRAGEKCVVGWTLRSFIYCFIYQIKVEYLPRSKNCAGL